ncbi:MAG TPA: hypothetical protein PLL00_00360 [Bacteroidia bacterium]|nr:hypothetical protein [Bacteroidia bacterium]
MSKKNYLFEILSFAASVFILVMPALINGYPLVYSDTGTYIATGFSGRIPFDRPIMYGFFIRHISLATSLWLVVIMQAIIVWFILWMFVRSFFQFSKNWLVTLSIVLFLSLTTGLANYTSQIMADIFTGVMLIGTGILLINPPQEKFLKICLGILVVLSLLVHASNLIIVTGLLLTILILKGLFKKMTLISVKHFFLTAILISSAWLLIPSINYLSGVGFKVSRAPSVFIMGRLVESGILKNYLDEHCADNSIPMCKYKDNLPGKSPVFLWDSESPLYKDGCIGANKHEMECWGLKNEEYSALTKAIFSSPANVKAYFIFAMKEAFIQFFHFNVEPLAPMGKGSPVFGNIEWRFKQDYQQYIHSKQFSHAFTYTTITYIQFLLVIICVIIGLIVFFVRKNRELVPSSLQIMLFLVVTGLVFNAIVCAALSMVADRFQGRLIWVFPLVILFTLHSVMKKRKAP